MLAAAMSNYWVTWFPGAILAALGVLVLAWKGIVNMVTAKRTLDDVRMVLPKIEAEFSRNGGNSMRDRVEALHDRQGHLDDRFRRHVGDDDRHFSKLEATLERIEDKL